MNLSNPARTAYDAGDPPAERDHHEVAALLNSVFQRMVAEVASEERWGLGPSHLRALTVLPATGIRVSELAPLLRMTKQGAGQLVSTLAEDGLVTQDADPTDGRARIVSRTPRADALLREVAAVLADVERAWARRVGERDYAAFRRVLDALGRADPDDLG